MRLPSYRSSHMLRYHPYPRVGLSQRENLMHITEENDALLVSHATLGTMLFLNTFIVKHVDDPLRNHNIECEDILESDARPGNDKQKENVLEAVEVPEAGGVLRVRRRKTDDTYYRRFIIRGEESRIQQPVRYVSHYAQFKSSSVIYRLPVNLYITTSTNVTYACFLSLEHALRRC
ncbi:hypothetical protein DFJ58DRAFT_432598 [Suillus subalutaceus]|uniref:uncharacterized protein n=1 Tax=Suillus subalutaceus TaxID=48586 RepID=UPI001B85ED29|nr:uncharacterized protein DFJ58DRAFT_432598 [Suillus subalutaceus]KAG1850586.1 hypothetical protein DFJ58DRAFT_432598 [Suillus subalutaceus]